MLGVISPEGARISISVYRRGYFCSGGFLDGVGLKIRKILLGSFFLNRLG